jgi:hypothetical protein
MKVSAYKALVTEENRILAWCRHRWRMQLGWGGMDWIELAKDNDQQRAVVNTVPSNSIKQEILE